MKPLLQSWTPTQLLWIIAASNALVSIGFGLLSLPAWRQGGQHLLLWYSFVALLLGLIASLIAERALRDGINSDQWSDSLLATPRKLASHPASSLLIGLLFAGSLASWASLGFHKAGGAWVFLFPTMALIRVRSYLHPMRKSDPLLPRDQPKPLQSDSWGTPPRPFSS